MFRVRRSARASRPRRTSSTRPKEWNSEVQTPIVYQKHMFAVGKKKRGLFTCLDLDGKQVWTSDGRASFELGSFILADGMFLILEGKTGMLRLLEASTTQYKELASAQVLRGPDVWGPLALVGRQARRSGPGPHGVPRPERPVRTLGGGAVEYRLVRRIGGRALGPTISTRRSGAWPWAAVTCLRWGTPRCKVFDAEGELRREVGHGSSRRMRRRRRGGPCLGRRAAAGRGLRPSEGSSRHLA